MPITPNKLYMVTLVGEIENQLTMNRFWVKGHTASPASTVVAEINGIYGGFNTGIIPVYRNFLSSRWHGNHISIVEMTTRPRQMLDVVLSSSGVQDAISLPAFAAGILSLRSGFADRTRNGRLFIPSPDSGSCDGSRLTGGAFGLLQAIGAAVLNVFGPTGSNTYGRIGIFSRKLGVTRVAGPPPVLNYSTNGWTACTEMIARSEIGTIRKRKLGRGQ